MDGAYLGFADRIRASEVETIVELGSRDGKDALGLSEAFDADVVAFECNPNAIPRCRRVLEGQDRVELVELAVWDKNETIDFYPVTNGNIGASSAFLANPEYPYERYKQDKVQVPATRLDTWWKTNKPSTPIDMLCMDLQGSELRALKGAGDLLKDVTWIITEVQFQRVFGAERNQTPCLDDLEQFLKEHKFDCLEVAGVNSWFGDALFRRDIYDTSDA